MEFYHLCLERSDPAHLSLYLSLRNYDDDQRMDAAIELVVGQLFRLRSLHIYAVRPSVTRSIFTELSDKVAPVLQHYGIDCTRGHNMPFLTGGTPCLRSVDIVDCSHRYSSNLSAYFRTVTTLRIDQCEEQDQEDEIVALLTASPVLDSLTLIEFQCWTDSPKICLPSLRSLSVVGIFADNILGVIDAPALQALSVTQPHNFSTSVCDVVSKTNKFPQLRSLLFRGSNSTYRWSTDTIMTTPFKWATPLLEDLSLHVLPSEAASVLANLRDGEWPLLRSLSVPAGIPATTLHATLKSRFVAQQYIRELRYGDTLYVFRRTDAPEAFLQRVWETLGEE
ncbi:hypothetical protein JAAARDRAFT_202293 [Jaapia argillacea MUCL 33604]|uniref:F-box/LRR-repeat protein 15/At3g58940/PEG3-like LRR domain-containing protein n=1 Tax=Jaapia argillacea MUCL 33604 TaxID=933084 RepID=A0A067QFU9_9AGAM|nr:hypothetical protein JAAARDRAFT_202293 [Jaapia argillacea MUCL 33604]